jgi:hypothetical protein
MVRLEDCSFTTPTFFDPLPALDGAPLDGNELVLPFDDEWRQVEFVSRQLGDVVLEEIAQILRIHETASEGLGGWRDVHIRTRPKVPLLCKLTLDELAAALHVTAVSGVTYWGAQGRCVNGYSLTAPDGLKLYGLAPRGKVEVMALWCCVDEDKQVASVDRLKTLASDLQLDLVDWPRCGRIPPEHPWFEALLRDEEPEDDCQS